MNEMLIFWLVLLILCIGIEVLTLGLTTIWFAGGALVAIFASLLYAPIFVQIILFFLVSLLMLFFTRPIAMRYFNKDRIKTNVESMVGRQAIVTGEIDNVKATGQVTVNGQEWTARSWDDRVKIPEGAVVTVRAINGVKLIVEIGEHPNGKPGMNRRPSGTGTAYAAGPAGKEEAPPEVNDGPAEGKETLPEVSDGPAEGKEAPPEVSDGPAEGKETLPEVSDGPAEGKEALPEVSDGPTEREEALPEA